MIEKYYFTKTSINPYNVFYFKDCDIPPMFTHIGSFVGENPTEAYTRMKSITQGIEVFVTYDKSKQMIVYVTEDDRKSVEALKTQWINRRERWQTGNWHLEKADGFESFNDELYDFRIAYEKKMKEKADKSIVWMAETFNCSIQVARYISNLEERIHRLEEKC